MVLLTLFCLFMIVFVPYTFVGILVARMALTHRMEELITICTDPSHRHFTVINVHNERCLRMIPRGARYPRTTRDIRYAFWAGVFWPIWLLTHITGQAIRTAPKSRSELESDVARQSAQIERSQAEIERLERKMLK